MGLIIILIILVLCSEGEADTMATGAVTMAAVASAASSASSSWSWSFFGSSVAVSSPHRVQPPRGMEAISRTILITLAAIVALSAAAMA